MQPPLLARPSDLNQDLASRSEPSGYDGDRLLDAADSRVGEVALLAQSPDLKAEIEQLRAERNQLAETQRRIMELLKTQSPEKIVHDLRNVLNERELLKALVDQM